MFTVDQIICHAVGDYLFQSHWMATEKGKKLWVAAIHALAYSIPFIFLDPTLLGFAVICVSHAMIDHYDLAKYVSWLKNLASPSTLSSLRGLPKRARFGVRPLMPLPTITATGYPDSTPPWLSGWLKIGTDNLMHILINGFALAYL